MGTRVATPANAITALRLLLVPVFAVLLLGHSGTDASWRIWATVVFAVASLTDRVDGHVARSRGEVTALGTFADPVADKALIGTALAGLSALGLLPWWVTGVVLAREAAVTGLRFSVLAHGVLPASRGGKVKTFLQAVAIGCYLLPLTGPAASARAWLMGLAVLVTIATGADYVGRAARWRRRSGPGPAGGGSRALPIPAPAPGVAPAGSLTPPGAPVAPPARPGSPT